jgi:hypothetical protein
MQNAGSGCRNITILLSGVQCLLQTARR